MSLQWFLVITAAFRMTVNLFQEKHFFPNRKTFTFLITTVIEENDGKEGRIGF